MSGVEKIKPTIGILKESLCLGGTERSAANISKILEKDFELFLLLFNSLDIKYPYGGNLIDINAAPKKSRLGKIYNSFVRYFRVKKILKNKDINILYEFISIENMLSIAKYKNVKRIISARDFGKMQRKTGKFHKALSKANAMICNSEYIKNFYLLKYPKDKDKVFTVYNIIDCESINQQATEIVEKEFIDFANKHTKIICAVGRFCKEKGFEYMLEAFAKVAEKIDLGLVMIGDGSYKEKYLKIIQKLKIEDKVYFTGFQNNPYKYMDKSDIFVLSSLSEGYPNVLVEAMSLGLPVIASNCYSGPAEILRNDCDYEAVTDSFEESDYGIITPRFTDGNNLRAIEQLSAALQILATDDSLAQKYSALSKQRALEYSFENARINFKGIIDKICINNDTNKS